MTNNGRFTPEQIRELRGELTQQEFAQQLGLAISTVQSWEQGKRKPSWDGMQALILFKNSKITLQEVT